MHSSARQPPTRPSGLVKDVNLLPRVREGSCAAGPGDARADDSNFWMCFGFHKNDDTNL